MLPSRQLLSRGHQWLANPPGRISAADLCAAALCGLQGQALQQPLASAALSTRLQHRRLGRPRSTATGCLYLTPGHALCPPACDTPKKTPLLCVLSQSTVTPRCESTLVLQSLPRGGFQPEFEDGCLGRQLGRVWKSSTLPGHGWGCPDPTGSQQGRAPPGHRHCPAAGAMEITRRQPRARKE